MADGAHRLRSFSGSSPSYPTFYLLQAQVVDLACAKNMVSDAGSDLTFQHTTTRQARGICTGKQFAQLGNCDPAINGG